MDKFITIDGKAYGVKFGHGAIMKWLKNVGLKRYVDIVHIPEKLSMSQVPEFVKDGFDSWAQINNQEEPFTQAEVNKLLEKHFWITPQVMTAFGESLSAPSSEDEAEEKETEGNEL